MFSSEKNHPKLYLWSKPWESPEKQNKMCNTDQNNTETTKNDSEANGDSMLMAILKKNRNDENIIDEVEKKHQPVIPQPEVAIESETCRLNLLEHVAQSQNLVEERLDEFEKCINDLEDNVGAYYSKDEACLNMGQVMNVLLKDLNTLQTLSQITSF